MTDPKELARRIMHAIVYCPKCDINGGQNCQYLSDIEQIEENIHCKYITRNSTNIRKAQEEWLEKLLKEERPKSTTHTLMVRMPVYSLLYEGPGHQILLRTLRTGDTLTMPESYYKIVEKNILELLKTTNSKLTIQYIEQPITLG